MNDLTSDKGSSSISPPSGIPNLGNVIDALDSQIHMVSSMAPMLHAIIKNVFGPELVVEQGEVAGRSAVRVGQLGEIADRIEELDFWTSQLAIQLERLGGL